jgi:glutamate/aspartate transport system substrate-binding protein
MNFPRIALCIAGLGFIAAGAAAHAQAPEGTLKKIKDSGKITLGVRESSSPFSFLDDQQKVVGYSIDLCMKIVDAVKADLKMPNLTVETVPVTSATRIPLMANGTIDLECGSTTNNVERQQQVGFAVTTFVTANRFVSKKSANLAKLEDLKGKTLVSTSGTSNLKEVTEINGQKNLGINVVPAAEHPAAFAMVETDRAQAFAMDDILLYGLVANSKTPGAYVISSEAISIQPYGIMLRRGDAAFKKVADNAIIAEFKSGDINKIYAKWFLAPIPPKNINLNVPMSDQLKHVIASPTDSGDPAVYK